MNAKMTTSLLCLTAALAACTQHVQPTHESTEEVLAALEQENGGFDDADEAVDEALYADIPSFDEAGDDTAIELADGARVLSVLVMWGHLPRYDGVVPQTSTDWTGSVQVTGGKLRVDRTMAFDQYDRLLPRTSPDTAAFVSHTLPHVDGLMLHVLQETEDAALVLTTKAATLTIRLADIAPALAGHTALGDGANGISFYAFANRPGCAEGFLFGRYHRMGAQVGRLHFRVVEDHGVEIGRVRGIYGYSKRLEDQVYFGKYVGLDGTHQGRLRGEYGEGRFSGLWRTDGPAVGTMGGLYWEGPAGKPGRGLAIGHWAEACEQ